MLHIGSKNPPKTPHGWLFIAFMIAWIIWTNIFSRSRPLEPETLALRSINQTTTREVHGFLNKIWTTPPQGHLKINVDIALKPYSTIIHMGFIMRNDTGTFMSTGFTTEFADNTKDGESKGLRQVSDWAWSLRSIPPHSQIPKEIKCMAAIEFFPRTTIFHRLGFQADLFGYSA